MLIAWTLLLTIFCFFLIKPMNRSPLKSRIQDGELLLTAFSQIQHLPKKIEYKNYRALWHELLEWQRLFGVSAREGMKSLRKHLILDLRMEKRIKEQIQSTLFEGMGILLIELIYIISTHYFQIFKLTLMELIGLLLYQCIGVIALFISAKFLKSRHFFEIEEMSQVILKLQVYSKGNLPVSRLSHQVPLQWLKQLKSKELKRLGDELWDHIGLLKKEGRSMAPFLEESQSELLYLREFIMESFAKQLRLVSFLVLALFFLMSFLAIILKLTMQML